MKDIFQQGLEAMNLELSDEAIEKQLLFLGELLRWNKKINLTSVRNEDKAVEKHLLDSLSTLELVGGSSSILDVGSGGGLPGIPLAIADQCLTVTSVDSVGKKINFQKHIKRLLNLNNFQAVHTRIEDLGGLDPAPVAFDVAVTRAFSSLETIFDVISPWVITGGKIVAMKGPEGVDEICRVEPFLSKFGLTRIEVKRYQLPFSSAERHIIIAYKK